MSLAFLTNHQVQITEYLLHPPFWLTDVPAIFACDRADVRLPPLYMRYKRM